MRNHDALNDLNNLSFTLPAAWDQALALDRASVSDLGEALEALLEVGRFVPAPPTVGMSGDLAQALELKPAPPAAAEEHADAESSAVVPDPLNPGDMVWQALEQEIEQEEVDAIHRSHLHHLAPPEELPDISNL